MKVLVAGVGGIGGWLAAALAKGGADVSLFVRGQTLHALQKDGLTLLAGEKCDNYVLPAFDAASVEQRFDLIIICVKTQDFQAICDVLKPLFTRGTKVIAAVNGLPWWFMQSVQPSVRLDSIDPDGRAAALLAEVVPVGAVVHASAHAVAPGVVRVVKADRLILGDVPGQSAVDIKQLADIFVQGGVTAPIVNTIREEVWAKLWGNMNMNPVSALTRLSATPILTRPDLRALVLAMMNEFDAIGQKLGLALPMSAHERIEITGKLGDFRTSMLADAEARRRLEHEGILGCVIELAQKLGIAAPVSKTVYALLTGLDHSFART